MTCKISTVLSQKICDLWPGEQEYVKGVHRNTENARANRKQYAKDNNRCMRV